MSSRIARKSRQIVMLTTSACLVAVPPSFAASVGRCGGTGHDHTAVLECPSGQLVVGMSARGGAFVDSVGLRCAPSGDSSATGSWKTGGTNGGTTSGEANCPRNKFVRNLVTSSAAYLDKVKYVGCSTNSSSGSQGIESAAAFRAGDGVGGLGGGQCSVACGSGEYLYKVAIRYGGWVDSVEGFCRRP